MSLFRKPRKAIQRRVFSEQDDEEPMDTDDSHTTSMHVKPSRDAKTCEKAATKINSSNTKQSLLSFETEEEGEVFQVKKSSHSKKMMRLYEKERRKREPKDNKIKEEENKEKKTHQQEIVTDDLIVVVNTSHNTLPVPPPPPCLSSGMIISGRDALYIGKDDLSSEEESEDPEDADINHRFSRPNNVKRVLESGAIPDAAMIHAARKRRQRAREQGEFIPVEDDEAEEKAKDTGRLVREDEHDLDGDNGSDDDEQRIDMGANPAQRDQERRREQFYEATVTCTGSSRLHDQDEDEDDVLHRWEDQQIRKGVTGASATASGLTQDMLLAAAAANAFDMTSAPQRVPHNFASVSPLMTSANDTDLNAPCTPNAILERLRQDCSQAIASRDQHSKRLEQVHSDLLQVAEELETLKLDGPRAAQRFRFYQELRGYVTDLVECLDEKVSLISDLEHRAMEMMTKKSEWLIERRRQDVRDQADELANAGKGNLGSAVRRAGSGAPNAEDEDKLRRAVEREGRRTRRRKAREMAAAAAAAGTIPVGNITTGPRHVQGMSSDDEMPPQQCTELEKEQQDMQALLHNVFEDVVADYSTVANILIKFEEWRETDLDAYNDAYATLCIPKIVSPLIRLQLVFWDPLSESSDDLEKLQWYRTLALYGLHDTETETTLSEDPDVGLLPAIAEKLIMPRITEFVERCWDPVSTSQTLRLVGVVTRCIRRFPSLGPDSRCLISLFKAILARIHTALEHDVFIPIVPKLTDAPRSPFFQRQFAGGLKLLRNITCWQGLLNDITLKELAINKLLNRYLLNGIKVCQLTDAVSKLGLISHILPRVWLQIDGEHLKMFNNCVSNLAQQLDKNNPVHLEPIETLTNILKCKRM